MAGAGEPGHHALLLQAVAAVLFPAAWEDLSVGLLVWGELQKCVLGRLSGTLPVLEVSCRPGQDREMEVLAEAEGLRWRRGERVAGVQVLVSVWVQQVQGLR